MVPGLAIEVQRPLQQKPTMNPHERLYKAWTARSMQIQNDVWWQFIGKNMIAAQKFQSLYSNDIYQLTDYLFAVPR